MTQGKYPDAKPTQVRVQEKAFGGLVPGEMVVIPSPHDIEFALRSVAPGTVTSQRELRKKLAALHKADNACPAMTGFQLRYVAETATDAMAAGVSAADVAPFWRVVEPDSKIASRLAGGAELIHRLRGQDVAAPSNTAASAG